MSPIPLNFQRSIRFPNCCLRIEFEYLIAQGGMGAVYKARQLSLDRDVAIKILPRELGDDPLFRSSFEAEAKAMARLTHPNLIKVYDSGDLDGMLYIVMEYVPGNRSSTPPSQGDRTQTGCRDRHRGLPRPRPCPRQWNHPPRHQTSQHSSNAEMRAKDRRLRTRALHPGRSRRARHGHPRLHGSGNRQPTRKRRPAIRCLCHRSGAPGVATGIPAGAGDAQSP